MGIETINGELMVDCPAGFKRMSIDELQKAYSLDYPNLWGIRDEERHIILTVLWKESNRLLSMLVSNKDLAKRAERALGKTYRAAGYKCRGFFSTAVAGQAAEGFHYDFEVDGVAQQGEVIVFKRDACCYTLYYYTRPELALANRAIHDEILASMALA